MRPKPGWGPGRRWGPYSRPSSRSRTNASCSTSTPRRISWRPSRSSWPSRARNPGSALAEREVVRAHTGWDIEREAALGIGGERDQAVEALALDGDETVMDVRARIAGGNRLAGEQNP